tara:strand:- start:264 stop:491 length:228 start_codon:yes stop_codon:yes gene_type:complete
MNEVYDALIASACQHDLPHISIGQLRPISNADGCQLLKCTYFGGKNKHNLHARWIDTSRGDDFLFFTLTMSAHHF